MTNLCTCPNCADKTKARDGFRPYTIQVTSHKQAALLETAPELLAALEALLNSSGCGCCGGHTFNDDKARAEKALDKATAI